MNQHVADLQMMNKGQEGHVGSENVDCEMSHKPKIRRRKLKEVNSYMSPKALRQVIENLNNKQKEAIKEIGFRGFLHLQDDMISGKLALWLVRNFDTCSCSLPLAYGRISVTEHDVHVMLGLPKGSLLVAEPKNESNLCYLDHVALKLRSVPRQLSTLRAWINGEIKSRAGHDFVIEFSRGYVEDTSEKMTITDVEEEVNEEQHRSKNDEGEIKVKDEAGVS
ncbi:hypothetical protein Cgig2_033100 [Carnegiea gigantea]|uniref:Uncharacterized protein n=1 Tax=Carnegiea gigantea TaxID=171969 RepID=A0A9Q1GRV8_9CARY|nr:hypothetical protein Cgig2_033100 [Carnegiea gigantea]